MTALDFTPETVLVLSDLHLGIGQDALTRKYEPRENFFADDALRALLEFHDPARHGPSLLVLNGDIWDFVRIDERPESDRDFRDWQTILQQLGVAKTLEELRKQEDREERFGLRTDDYKSIWKLLLMARGHPGFFRALGWWIERGGWIVVVKGNHDVELHWPLVQRAVRLFAADGGDARAVEERFGFAQDGFTVGNLYLEHGHQFESMTAVEGDPTVRGGTELNIPPGSWVNRYVINRLEGIEPFLDNIKPLNQLLWRMFRKHPVRMVIIAFRSWRYLPRALKRYRLRDTVTFLLYFGTLIVPLATIVIVLAVLLGYAFRIEAITDIVDRISLLWRSVAAAVGFLFPYLGGLLKDLKDFIVGKRRPAVGEDHYGESVYARLRGIQFGTGYSRVYAVLGHTHQQDVQVLPAVGSAAGACYVNSGSWVPLWDEKRPDLLGRVKYAVTRFRLGDNGEYRHECLEWSPERNTVIPATILARKGSRQASGPVAAAGGVRAP